MSFREARGLDLIRAAAENAVEIFDSTLRDGAQGEGISFSPEDKLAVVKALDYAGIDYIEAGNPGSNPKDMEFFKRVRENPPRRARLVAFGSTRRKGIRAEEDENCLSLLKAGTEAVAVFGKAWDMHVTEIIRTGLEENLNMIRDTVSFFKSNGREVIFDAEHFFDGFKNSPQYAIEALRAAHEAGADRIVLCETNGGCLPDEVGRITAEAVKSLPGAVIGIHCHDDSGCAAANSLAAVSAGARHVQGTYLGYGERCGNANLSTIIPNLQIKMGFACVPEQCLERFTRTARWVSEIANQSLYRGMPYVGGAAFSHKAGMHIDAVAKEPGSFEHISPETVGNERRFLMSEVAGRGTVLKKISRIAPELTKASPETAEICSLVKQLEFEGYSFEAAEASFELLVKRVLGRKKTFFTLNYFKTVVDEPNNDRFSSSAIIKITVGDKTEITAAEGDGPVHALDNALRRALEGFYPLIGGVHLTDYKVRVLEPQKATGAKVRVLIESSDETGSWSTVGVSTDVIDASWKALVESVEYRLMKEEEINKKIII
ncbi:MAG TPA: citramalate synthase [Candidatus Monoglobus merdigallinarum]|uniref:Citramalate synthase n=1 Tax=Candidatus Monoglobus merdigallinarum TaxID=2838698 RepID=A0A9D1PS78_9FIRM|nr:citramalate synthase [Candidatus Monoglobus merdigallinarum]